MAELLGLTYAERTELKITTIGAKDVDAAGRAAQYAAKKRSRDRASAERRRRARGAVSRPEYLARNPLSQTCPWKQEGIHRRTWERRRARAAASSSPAIASTATPSPTILSSC